MSSTPPRVSGDPNAETHRRWVEEQLRQLRNDSDATDMRVRSVTISSSTTAGLASSVLSEQSVLGDRVLAADSNNRLARPITDSAYWNSIQSGAKSVWTVPSAIVPGSFEFSTWRNVTWSVAGGFVFQPNGTTEAAEAHITPILTIPSSQKIYVEAEYPGAPALRPQIYIEWRDVNGVGFPTTTLPATLVTSKTTLNTAAAQSAGAVKYTVKLVRPAGAGVGGTIDPKVFEVVGTDGMGIGPGGVVVNDGAGNPTMEINPGLPVLAAPSLPSITSSAAQVTVRWNGSLTSGVAPAHLSYVYAEEGTSASGPWTRAGQPLNRAGDIVLRPPVGTTRWYRLFAVDTSNRVSPASATGSVVVAGVSIPDLSGDIGAVIDTVDGLNKIFYSDAASTPTAHANGDLWYIVDPITNNVTGVRSWNGSDWVPLVFVADSIFVPGSVGTISMQDGSVTAPKVAAQSMTADKMAVGVLDGQIIRGAYMESPTIASGPNVGAVDLLPDPTLATAPDTTWVASGWLGDAGNINQDDVITWDQTYTAPGGAGSYRMRGNMTARMYVKARTRSSKDLTFRSAAGLYAVTTRTINNPHTYAGYSESARTDNSLTKVGVTPYLGTLPSRTTYLRNTSSAVVAVGDNLRIDWSIVTPDVRSSSTGDDLRITAQIIKTSDSSVLAEFIAPEASGSAMSGSYFSAYTSTYAGSVTLRFRSDYNFSGAGIERRVQTGGFLRRDTISGSPSTPDYNQSTAGYALDPFDRPNYDVTPAASQNNMDRYAASGLREPSRNFAQVTLGRLSRLNPSSGFLITQEGGFQAFDTLGRVTARINGQNNLLSGELRTTESGAGIRATGATLTAADNVQTPTGLRTVLNEVGVIVTRPASGGDAKSTLTTDGVSASVILDGPGSSGALASLTSTSGLSSLILRNTTGSGGVLAHAGHLRSLTPLTDAQRVALTGTDLFEGLSIRTTDTKLDWVYTSSAWRLVPGQMLAYAATTTTVNTVGNALVTTLETPVLPIGQALNITTSALPAHHSAAGQVVFNIRWLNSATNVTSSTGSVSATRVYNPGANAVITGPGQRLRFVTTAAAKVSANTYLASAGTFYGPDGFAMWIESA